MQYYEESQIDLPLPFLQHTTILYVDGMADKTLVRTGRKIHKPFKEYGLKFLLLPELKKSLKPSIIGYLFPGSQRSLDIGQMYHNIIDFTGLDGQSGFLYKIGEDSFFYALPEFSQEKEFINAAYDFINFLFFTRSAAKNDSKEIIRNRYADLDEISDLRFSISEACYSVAADSMPPSDAEKVKVAEEKEVEQKLDSRTRLILRIWKRIEKRFNITIEDLRIILALPVKLSRIKIAWSGKITLPDWEGSPEVKMDKLTKALYFFYLRHPEGIAQKDLVDYEQEILGYYSRISGCDDPEKIRESVRNFVNPLNNSVNVSMSRIKKAFKDIVDDRIAQFYYIKGQAGEPRKIAIDRDLVIWEH
ncbi:MAG: hypothetical protein ILP04_03415 [Bacteroidales bacterium]|nr:hypothetical protein [Bacteroidales bacterium]